MNDVFALLRGEFGEFFGQGGLGGEDGGARGCVLEDVDDVFLATVGGRGGAVFLEEGGDGGAGLGDVDGGAEAVGVSVFWREVVSLGK